MDSKSYLQCIGPSNDGLDAVLAPPASEVLLTAPIFKAPANTPLIPSPTKRGRATDKSKRSKRLRSSQLPIPPKNSAHEDICENFEALSSIATSSPVELNAIGFDEYVDAVIFESAGFMQISCDVCVVQGWHARLLEATDSWYHAQFAIAGTKVNVACQCPTRSCFHGRFLQEFYGTEFVPNLSLPSALDTPVCFFYRQGLGNGCFKNIFSVLAASGSPLNRAIVMYEGLDTGVGSWTCSKDSRDAAKHGTACLHMKLAADELGLIASLPGNADADSPLITSPICRVNEEIAVSYLPILPPIWAIIPSDEFLYTRPPPVFPDNVIWDGVTLAFHKRQLLSSIHPPTSTSDASEVRPTKYLLGQQLLPFPQLRKSLRAISGGDESRSQRSHSDQSSTCSAPSFIDIGGQLQAISPPLANLFKQHFDPNQNSRSGREIPRPIRRFFFQVAAEESAVQLLNQQAQEALKEFIANPCIGTEQYLRGSPHIYDLAHFDRKACSGLKYSTTLLAALNWIFCRSATVLLQLFQNSPPPENWAVEATGDGPDSDWESDVFTTCPKSEQGQYIHF
ncbi:hypothetical protein AGABI2DRAFT_120130 [Agaricus bisporus var. bisporus H97]|uniref:hypothetical protein n=1 Tax=Agaricus bisporus var. bisporus (strain H97 / ATCC MYA-4626 / FGSC 10389) TaxID=936046 RepID=UPI00029F7579|nr:hypothetical protein AGABI2DRAFT_120130 [Agaricus bisporus var. bisporus H97]EKV45164.1 hypothetical protein AGABI2DRAFT_120130 [Agaricus bisporus var. bisporus H97]